MRRRLFERTRTPRSPDDLESRGLSRRTTRLLVIAGASIVLILAYLSALILIEGARDPARLPENTATEDVQPPGDPGP